MRKSMSVALSVLVSLSMAACAPRNTAGNDDINRNTRNSAMLGQYKDGVYTGYSDGTGNNRQMATVTIRNGRIVDVDLTTAGNQNTNTTNNTTTNNTTNNIRRTGTNTSRLGTGTYTTGRTNYGNSGMQTGRDVRNNTTGITRTGTGNNIGTTRTTEMTRTGTGNNANTIFQNYTNITTPTQFAPNYGKGNNSIVAAPRVPGGGYGPNYTPSYGTNYTGIRGGYAGAGTGAGTGVGTTRYGTGVGYTPGTGNAGYGTTTGTGTAGIGATTGTGTTTGLTNTTNRTNRTGTNNNVGNITNRFGTNGTTNNGFVGDNDRITITPRTVNSVTAGRNRTSRITETNNNTGRTATNINNGFMNTGVGSGTGVGGGAEAGFGTGAGTTGITGTTGTGYGTTGTNIYGAIDNNQYDSITRVRSWLTGAILQSQTYDIDLTTIDGNLDNRTSMDVVGGWQLAVRRALDQARR